VDQLQKEHATRGKLINQMQDRRHDTTVQRECQDDRWGRERDRDGGWLRECVRADRSRDKGQATTDEKAGGEGPKPG